LSAHGGGCQQPRAPHAALDTRHGRPRRARRRSGRAGTRFRRRDAVRHPRLLHRGVRPTGHPGRHPHRRRLGTGEQGRALGGDRGPPRHHRTAPRRLL
ncbi:uncharacterized protein METZ01_LOCUS149999, partial [marine metagenome]